MDAKDSSCAVFLKLQRQVGSQASSCQNSVRDFEVNLKRPLSQNTVEAAESKYYRSRGVKILIGAAISKYSGRGAKIL